MKKAYRNHILILFIKRTILLFLISFLLECTVGNFRFFESMFYNAVELNYTIGEGIVCDNELCSVVSSENSYLEIDDIEESVKNIEVQFAHNNRAKNIFSIHFVDQGNSLWYEAGRATYYQNIEKTHYIRVHSSGETKALRIYLDYGTEFSLPEIRLNVSVPWMFNALRLVVIFGVLFTASIFYPSSIIYKITLNNKIVIPLLFFVVIGLSLFFYKLTTFNLNVNSFTSLDDWSAYYSQYKNLAEAFAKGQLHLDLEVSEELLKLSNPYDCGLRMEELGFGNHYYHDYAYFEGKYYSYFGALPCLLFYLPYYLLTGSHIDNYVVVGICSFLFVTAAFYFVYHLCKKYFPKISVAWVMLFSLFLVFSSGIMTALGCPTFYNIPILLGLSLSLFGLSFWIQSINKGKLHSVYLFLGSILIAAVSWCRPQLLMTMFFGVVLFFESVFKNRTLFSKKSIRQTISFCAPFIVIASLLMLYNYSRFGSPFDFGANYNLTSNDMRQRGFEIDRIVTGIYYYLFAPVHFDKMWPFIKMINVSTEYIGITIHESLIGGYFSLNLISVFAFIMFGKKYKQKNPTLYCLALAALLFGVVIIVADTEMAGILTRYHQDFSWLITLFSVISFLFLLDEQPSDNIKWFIVLGIVLVIIFNSFTYFVWDGVVNNSNLYDLFLKILISINI